MFKIFLNAFLVVVIFLTCVNAQNPQVILELAWGNGEKQVGFRQAPDANYGPQAFSVAQDKIILLDAVQNRLKVFAKNEWLKSMTIVPFSDDFVWQSEDEFVVLSQNRLYFYQDGRPVRLFEPESPLQIIETLNLLNSQELQINFSDQASAAVTISKSSLKKPFLKGNVANIKTIKLDQQSFEVKSNEGRSKILHLEETSLASVRYLGHDEANRHYLSLEFFEQQVPLRVRRELRVFDDDFNLLLKLQIPVNNYTEIFRDWYIGQQGQFYQMFTTEQGIKVVRWNLQSFFNPQNPTEIKYPEVYFKSRHYNFLDSNIEPGTTGQLHKVNEFEDFPQVLPSDALAVGDEYVAVQWTATAKNLTNGVVTDSYGNQVRTPDWIKVGQNKQVPYKWGGFESLEAFLYGIEILKYAGDNYTDNGGTPSAVGVDCSGFVSRCWNLPRHYATSMMDDGLTLPYTSWSEAEPGDAVHKVGHVRMVVKQNNNGSLLVVESSGRDWRVSYRTYYYSSLSNYTPRYYVNRQGAPGNIPQPRLDLVQVDERLKINWSLEGLENVSSVRLYFSTDGNSWSSSFSVPKDTLQWSVPVHDDQMIFVKIRSFSAGTLQNPSVSSDIYGVYRRDEKAKVLIVDGFDRTSASSGRWHEVNHPFVVSWGKALARAGIPFETTTNEMVKKGQVSLNDYPAVFYLLGDESYLDATFDRDEQVIVKNYLQNGGRLFVSGSEVGYDLANLGNSYDQFFFSDFLKADYVKDNAGSNEVVGEANTLFSGLELTFDNGLYGTYAVPYPDAITPRGGAKQALKYANGQGAAICFEGLFPGGSKAGKLFYMGFPFETIYQENQRDSLMSRIVQFFELDQLSSLEVASPSQPQQFRLIGNFPNPFNNATQIRFELPSAGKVSLIVFNSLGQRVWQKAFSFSTGGLKQIHFNGNQLPSGLYLYQIHFTSHQQNIQKTGKMVLVK